MMGLLQDAWDSLSDGAKHIGDIISVGAVVGWIFAILPSIATLLTIVWMCIRIWETDTVRGWTGRAK